MSTSTAAALKTPAKRTATRQATAQPAPAPNALKRWAATNGGGSKAQTPTLAQALAVAKNYDLVLATKNSYPPFVSQMRQANPDLRLIVYLNGTYAQSDQGSAYPDGWYARAAVAACAIRHAAWTFGWPVLPLVPATGPSCQAPASGRVTG